jgi:hypothetical protein
MLHLVGARRKREVEVAAEDFGAWTDHCIPQDRSAWHPLVRQFYEHWPAVTPPHGLPGRQHIVPEDIVALWSHLFMVDVNRAPLRYRYRFCGTELVRAFGREVTGCWLDEVHPEIVNPVSRERFRYVVETGSATWRRGPPLWSRHSDHRIVESCLAPLAADGCVVDKIFGVVVPCDGSGRPR